MYLKTVGFINDLEFVDRNHKKVTREKLFQIMDSDNNLIDSRGNDIHNLLRI